MSRGGKVGCLLALNLWALGGGLLIALLADEIDQSALLKLIAMPIIMIMPFGPPILLMALFAMLGSTRRSKRIARMGAAFAFYVPYWFLVATYAFSGTFTMTTSELPILLGALVIGGGLSWWGFRRDPAPA